MEIEKAKEAKKIIEKINKLEEQLKALKEIKSLDTIILCSNTYRSGGITFNKSNSDNIYNIIVFFKESEIKEANLLLKDL